MTESIVIGGALVVGIMLREIFIIFLKKPTYCDAHANLVRDVTEIKNDVKWLVRELRGSNDK